MKVIKFLAAALAALTMVACIPTPVPDNNNNSNEKGFKVTASTRTIAADGVDAVQFNATFNGEAIPASDLVAKVNGTEAEMPGLKFTTTTAGTYTINFTYGDLTSEDFQIEAVKVGGLDLSPIDEQGLTLRATTTVFQKGVEECLIIVRYKGEVIDPAKVTFYDLDTTEEVSLESKDVTDVNGVNYKLAIYAPTEVGTRNLWAARNSGPGDSRNKPLSLTAVDFAIPSRAIDPQPENTSFNKRMFVTQFTGTECGYCPFFIAAIHALGEDPEYGDKFVLAAVHTYSNSDPMYPIDYSDIDKSFGVSSYPTVICDMRNSLGNNGYAYNLQQLQSQVNKSLAETAKAGISAKINYADGIIVARATVKAAEAGNYRIGAWLVEDDIHGMQYNNGCKEDVDFNTHEAAVRIPDSKPEGAGHYAGHSLGTLAEGELADYVFVMNVKQDQSNIDNPKKHWKSENCRMVFFVTVEGSNGTYVTNVVENDNLTQTITFDYQ